MDNGNRRRILIFRASAARGFTLVELLACVAIIALLGAVLIAAVNGVRTRAKVAGSLSNLRQMGMAAYTYSADNDGNLMPHALFDEDLGQNREWCYGLFQYGATNQFAEGLLGQYLEDAQDVLTCPLWEPEESIQTAIENASAVPGNLGYGYNGLQLSKKVYESDGSFIGNYLGHSYSVVIKPNRTVMFAISATPAYSGYAAPQEMIWGPSHQTAGANPICIRLVNNSETLVCWVDGSVEQVNAIPVTHFEKDGIYTGYIDADNDGIADEDIWAVQ
ncbi:type II secretion system protein [Cerasicoccus frondis]|uniref:type II secretion system protein n=1 Tax=Cerasicoccus frondis TaxID=490090 RepID=UPI002852D99E|nr:type II secretion system protein [Cerasicoccus frondis]